MSFLSRPFALVIDRPDPAASITAVTFKDVLDFALLLVDDHPLFRGGMTLALTARAPGLYVVPLATPEAALGGV